MLETFVPLIIDTGGDPDFDVNIPDNIVLDPERDQIYTFFQSYSSTSQPIWTSNYTTGLEVERNLPTFPVSSSNRFQSGTAVLIDGFMYVVSYQIVSDIATLKLSKLDPTSMTETAAVALTAAGKVFALVNFKTCSFTLDGVNYVAVALSEATGANIEIFNVDTMASVDSFDYPDAGGECWLVTGNQPTVTTQKIFLIADGASAGDEPPFVSFTFDKGTGQVTGATVATISASDIDVDWLDIDEIGAHAIDISSLMFDASDGHIIFASWNVDWETQGGTPGYLVKLNAETGAIVWVVPVPYIPNAFDQAARFSDLSEGELVFVPPVSVVWPDAVYGAIPADTGVYYIINTADGSYETAFSSHFALGPESAAVATERAHLYDSTTRRLYYFSSGPESDWQDDGSFAETIGPPWYEGWMILVSDAEEVEPMVGGSGVQLEPLGCILTAQPYALQTRDLNSILELGPFRFVEQKESDETSMITSLVLGLTECDIGLVVEIDMATETTITIVMDTLVDILGDDIYVDMGEGTGNSDDFTLELLGNDDGSTYPGSPIEFKPETLTVIEDRGSVKQYSPTGYSFIYHRLRLKATQVDEKFAVKFVDLSGQLTGRYL